MRNTWLWFAISKFQPKRNHNLFMSFWSCWSCPFLLSIWFVSGSSLSCLIWMSYHFAHILLLVRTWRGFRQHLAAWNGQLIPNVGHSWWTVNSMEFNPTDKHGLESWRLYVCCPQVGMPMCLVWEGAYLPKPDLSYVYGGRWSPLPWSDTCCIKDMTSIRITVPYAALTLCCVFT